jgi:predicted dehydrogenase
MNTNPIVIGMIGAGFSATFHVHNYRLVPGLDIRIKGVTARSQESATAFAEEHNLETVYPTAEALFADEEITVVDLCVPNYLHYPLTVQAAEAGKHIICEKPLTGYFGTGGEALVGRETPRRKMFEAALKAADEMVDVVRHNGVTFCYGENWVHAPSVQKANDILAQSDNTILRIVAEESHSGSHSAYAKEWRYSGGGSLFNKGCHPVGGALYLKYNEGLRKYGKPIKPKSVVAEVANLTQMESFLNEDEKWIQGGWKDCEDWGSMIITFADDSIAQITASDIVLGGIQNVMTVYSSKAVVQCNINPNTGMLTYAPSDHVLGDTYIREKVETRAGWQPTNPDEDWMNGFPHELQDFCEAIAYGRQPKSTVELARDIVAVCYGAYISAETGQRFMLSDWL